MEQTHVLALDAGTTSVRAILFDREGSITAIAQEEFGQIYPQPGWVEHDPEAIWTAQRRVIHEVLGRAAVAPQAIAAIGITNQRETTVVWDRATGEPVYNAIVWQDGRTSAYCDELRASGLEEQVRATSGLLLASYFSATKLRWILQNVPGVAARAARGELAFGTIDSWLVWKLTDGAAHVIDHSNASRTLLLDIHEQRWDPTMLELLQIPESLLPQVRPSSDVYGVTGAALGLDAAIPVAGAVGDQQGALFGQTCFRTGQIKATYGTGGSVMMNTGGTPTPPAPGLLTTIGWGIDGRVEYALEGVLFAVGVPVQWLRDELGIISSAAETETLAAQVPDSNGTYLVPAFVGLGSPHWDPYARAAILGIERSTNRKHLCRAALESMAYQYKDLVDAMEAASGITTPDLRVDGGAVTNNLLLQFQADLLGVPVHRPEVIESTARGAAFLAGLAVKFWASQEDIADSIRIDRTFSPAMDDAERARLHGGWLKALSRAKDWLDH